MKTSQQAGNVTYSVKPDQITRELQSSPNSEFIVIQRTRQGEQPHVWSSGDPEQTAQLFRQVSSDLQTGAVGQRQTENA